jgi:ectoine hydroxylase-related dioxygenase (phytanoyl-CoA dioxygenase family)
MMIAAEKLHQLATEGWCVLPSVISHETADAALAALWAARRDDEANGGAEAIPGLDPNERNVRVFNLIDRDPLFVDLVENPVAVEVVRAVLGETFSISNFTANIALPGSKSMEVHSDQALVVPEPWVQTWSVNIIWCLTDATEANGSTRFLPGSHHFTSYDDVPADIAQRMRAFEAPKGSIVAMDGRIWHTSGANVTADQERALCFGYYSRSFLRPQQNWNVSLSPETLQGLSPQMRRWLGLEAKGNRDVGRSLLKLGVDD